MERKLSVKQERFVREYVATGNASLAASRAYHASSGAVARSIGSENLTKPNIQMSIRDALMKAGVSSELIGAKIAELINAKRRVSVVKNGEADIIKDEMDTQAVKAGLDLAIRFLSANENDLVINIVRWD